MLSLSGAVSSVTASQVTVVQATVIRICQAKSRGLSLSNL